MKTHRFLFALATSRTFPFRRCQRRNSSSRNEDFIMSMECICQLITDQALLDKTESTRLTPKHLSTHARTLLTHPADALTNSRIPDCSVNETPAFEWVESKKSRLENRRQQLRKKLYSELDTFEPFTYKILSLLRIRKYVFIKFIVLRKCVSTN